MANGTLLVVRLFRNLTCKDENARAILSQICTLTLAAGQNLTADVPIAERKYTFRLAKGMQVGLPMTAQVSINLAAKGAAPAPQAITVASNQIEIRSKSKGDADDDAAKTVYGEMNQELRRTRTLYETFLVVVTGALATVFSQRSAIAGAYKPEIGYGLGFLALVVAYMIWQIAKRYRDTTTALFNLERFWGLRAGGAGEYPLDAPSSWWKNHAWRHTIWAIGLTAYAVLAILIVIAILRAPAEPQKAPPQQSIAVTCSGPTQSGATQTTAGPGTSTSGKKPGGKTK